MPRDLPGLYWDEERKRYFPLSSRPKAPLPPPVTITSSRRAPASKPATRHSNAEATNAPDHEKPRRFHLPLHSKDHRLMDYRTSWTKDQHGLLCYHYACTSRLSRTRIPTLGHIQTFCSTQINDHTWRFIGDDQGWMYSDQEIVLDPREGMNCWSSYLYLQPASPISTISISGSRCVSTCLGPGKIAVQDLTAPERMFLLNITGVNDIRTSDLQGRTLALGASKKAVYISDIDASNSPQYLHTKSDVFSIIQDQTLVYTGARNGTIERFDMRLTKKHGQKLFDARFGDVPRSSVLHLKLIRDHEILVSHLNGDLVTFDMRFPSAIPLKWFEGHVNRDVLKLGIAVDTTHDLLFAAGQDCRIRGWSLRTGQPLSHPAAADIAHLAHNNPFLSTFPTPVVTLQVTDEPGEAGNSLWAASDHELYQFHLGQRTMIC